MKLRFNDGVEIVIQQAIESSGHLTIKILNLDREVVLNLFRDTSKTRTMTIIDQRRSTVYEKYINFNYLTQHSSGIIEVGMIQEGKSNVELINELMGLISVLEQQVTDTQIALCEVYELMG